MYFILLPQKNKNIFCHLTKIILDDEMILW